MLLHRLSLCWVAQSCLTLCDPHRLQPTRLCCPWGYTDWFQVGKGVRQGWILSTCWFNFYAEYIMRKAGLEEVQAGIKIARRNINNLRYADDTTFYGRKWRRTKEPFDKVKEKSEKAGLKLKIQKTKLIACGPITSWQIDGETVADYFGGVQNHCRWWLQPWN